MFCNRRYYYGQIYVSNDMSEDMGIKNIKAASFTLLSKGVEIFCSLKTITNLPIGLGKGIILLFQSIQHTSRCSCIFQTPWKVISNY